MAALLPPRPPPHPPHPRTRQPCVPLPPRRSPQAAGSGSAGVPSVVALDNCTFERNSGPAVGALQVTGGAVVLSLVATRFE
jgi:hypothetical protein